MDADDATSLAQIPDGRAKTRGIAFGTRALERVFHTDRLQLTLISTAVPDVQRHYPTGAALRRDVVDARLWLGVHVRFADTAARDMGLRLSSWALDHYFQRVEEER